MVGHPVSKLPSTESTNVAIHPGHPQNSNYLLMIPDPHRFEVDQMRERVPEDIAQTPIVQIA